MGIGSNIEKIRKNVGLSTKGLSEQSGLSERTLRSVYVENSDPKISTLKKIIIALGTSADLVIFDDEELIEDTDLKVLFRELNTLSGEKREYAKKVIKGIIIQMKSEEIYKF